MSTFTVMYNATVHALSFADQCRVAQMTGCSALSISPSDYLRHLAGGISTADLRSMAADHGVTITHLEPFARWTQPWQPTQEYGPLDPTFMAFDEADFFRMATALGCRSFCALGSYPRNSIPLSHVIDLFGALCARAAAEGLRVDLEFIPMLGVDSLTTAWEVIRTVDASNSGIMFDMWHHRRSNSSDEFLRTIPGRRITGVQLNDGPAVPPPSRSLIEDCLMHRRAPGEGDFRVRDTVAVLRETGGLNNVGPEIFSAVFDSMSAEEIASRTRESMASVLD